MTPPDARYAHWQQQPDDELDYRPEPDLRDVTLETFAAVAEALQQAAEEEACREP